MRVLITGGYGFIGAWIIRNLLARGDQVWVYDLKEDPRRLRLILPEAEVAKVAFVQGDVTDLPRSRAAHRRRTRSRTSSTWPGLQVPTCRADPMLGAKVNVLGTLAVFEAVKAAGEQVKRLVYASSAAVFGGPDKYPAGPAAPTTCRSSRARTTASSSAATRATPASTSRTTASPASACGRGRSTASAATSA